MSLDLGRRMLAAGTLAPGEMRRALFDCLLGEKPLARALTDCSPAMRALLARALSDGEHPAIRAVKPDPALHALLPPGLCGRLLVMPIGREPLSGAIDFAVVDPLDTHLQSELSFHCGARVRLLAAPLSEIEGALLIVGEKRVEQSLSRTADYPSAAAPAPTPPQQSDPHRARIQPLSQPPTQDAVPLVRRSATQRTKPVDVPHASEPPEAIPLSRTRMTVAPAAPTTTPIDAPAESEPRPEPAPAVQMVVDFRQASRAEKREGGEKPTRRKLEPKRPPFPSITKVLEAIDAARDRAALIEALLRGLLTTSVAAALFAPRKGRFVGVGAIGDLDAERIRTASLPPTGAVADAIGKNERLGTLDPHHDVELYAALGLERFSAVHVLIFPAYVADKAALLLVSFGMGDVLESTRRARVLSTAAAAAMERMLRK